MWTPDTLREPLGLISLSYARMCADNPTPFAGDECRAIWYLFNPMQPTTDLPFHTLTSAEREAFLGSSDLVNLRIVDLRGQDIDDEFMRRLCNTSTFSRIHMLVLDNNPRITAKTLDYILRSKALGAIRDFPIVSEQYKRDVCNVCISASDTGITEHEAREYDNKFAEIPFAINYLHPISNAWIDPTAPNGLKQLHITRGVDDMALHFKPFNARDFQDKLEHRLQLEKQLEREKAALNSNLSENKSILERLNIAVVRGQCADVIDLLNSLALPTDPRELQSVNLAYLHLIGIAADKGHMAIARAIHVKLYGRKDKVLELDKLANDTSILFTAICNEKRRVNAHPADAALATRTKSYYDMSDRGPVPFSASAPTYQSAIPPTPQLAGASHAPVPALSGMPIIYDPYTHAPLPPEYIAALFKQYISDGAGATYSAPKKHKQRRRSARKVKHGVEVAEIEDDSAEESEVAAKAERKRKRKRKANRAREAKAEASAAAAPRKSRDKYGYIDLEETEGDLTDLSETETLNDNDDALSESEVNANTFDDSDASEVVSELEINPEYSDTDYDSD